MGERLYLLIERDTGRGDVLEGPGADGDMGCRRLRRWWQESLRVSDGMGGCGVERYLKRAPPAPHEPEVPDVATVATVVVGEAVIGADSWWDLGECFGRHKRGPPSGTGYYLADSPVSVTVGRYEIPGKREILSFIINKVKLFRFDRIQLCRLSCRNVPEICRPITKNIFPIRSSRPVDRI